MQTDALWEMFEVSGCRVWPRLCLLGARIWDSPEFAQWRRVLIGREYGPGVLIREFSEKELILWLRLRGMHPTKMQAKVIMHGEIRPIIRTLFINGARYGELEKMKWLVRTFFLDRRFITGREDGTFRCAAENGHLEVLKWLTETFYLSDFSIMAWNRDAIRKAAMGGHLEVLKWMNENFNIKKYDILWAKPIILLGAANAGQLEIVQWLVETFGISRSDLLRNGYKCYRSIARRGELGVVEWLVERFNLDPKHYT